MVCILLQLSYLLLVYQGKVYMPEFTQLLVGVILGSLFAGLESQMGNEYGIKGLH